MASTTSCLKSRNNSRNLHSKLRSSTSTKKEVTTSSRQHMPNRMLQATVTATLRNSSNPGLCQSTPTASLWHSRNPGICQTTPTTLHNSRHYLRIRQPSPVSLCNSSRRYHRMRHPSPIFLCNNSSRYPCMLHPSPVLLCNSNRNDTHVCLLTPTAVRNSTDQPHNPLHGTSRPMRRPLSSTTLSAITSC